MGKVSDRISGVCFGSGTSGSSVAGAGFRAGLAAFLAAAMLAAALLVAGCSSGASGDAGAGGGAGSAGAGAGAGATVRIGTMPTEDFLPMWAAERNGLFAEAGIEAELLSFDSAQALSAAIAAGEVDMAMVDVPRAVKLCESGTPVVMEWVTLGTDASQGAFGVLAAAEAPYSTLSEMAAYLESDDVSFGAAGVGVAANTVPEYVFDMLCAQEGIDVAALPVQEVASLPERYGLAASGNLAAAALPASLLRLGEASGMKVLAEDTQGENISQSVMVARASFAEGNPEAVLKVAQAWDAAVEAINADPAAYASLLAENANLNDAIADSYPVSTYPAATDGEELAHPAASLVNPQLAWMKEKGYSSHEVSYDEATGSIEVG